MQVQEIMTNVVDVIDPNATIRDAARRMRADNVGALPVCDDQRLLGVVTDRDIVVRAVADDLGGGTTAVREVMSEGVCYCNEDDDVGKAAEIMARHQVRRLPVVSREKQLVGFVALADLARCGVDVAMKALAGVSEPTEKERR
jgi:CBS domain-containing protein